MGEARRGEGDLADGEDEVAVLSGGGEEGLVAGDERIVGLVDLGRHGWVVWTWSSAGKWGGLMGAARFDLKRRGVVVGG